MPSKSSITRVHLTDSLRTANQPSTSPTESSTANQPYISPCNNRAASSTRISTPKSPACHLMSVLP